jgi:hypothetical protein
MEDGGIPSTVEDNVEGSTRRGRHGGMNEEVAEDE